MGKNLNTTNLRNSLYNFIFYCAFSLSHCAIAKKPFEVFRKFMCLVSSFGFIINHRRNKKQTENESFSPANCQQFFSHNYLRKKSFLHVTL